MYKNYFYVSPEDIDLHELKRAVLFKEMTLFKSFFLRLFVFPPDVDIVQRHRFTELGQLQLKADTEKLRITINKQHA